MKMSMLLAGFISAVVLGLSAFASPVSVVSVDPQILAATPTTAHDCGPPQFAVQADALKTINRTISRAVADTGTCALPGGAALGVATTATIVSIFKHQMIGKKSGQAGAGNTA